MNADVAETHERRFVFDALGDRGLVELPSHADDPPDEALVGGVSSQISYELRVDLQVLRRNLLEIVEARVARAEVIQRQSAAQRRHLLGEQPAGVELLDHRGLGHLDDQQRWIGPGLLSAEAARAGLRVPDRHRREVELDRLTTRRQSDRLAGHPAVDLGYQPKAFGDRQEVAGRDDRPSSSRIRSSNSCWTVLPDLRSTIGWL